MTFLEGLEGSFFLHKAAHILDCFEENYFNNDDYISHMMVFG